jgi:hypothetical protein
MGSKRVSSHRRDILYSKINDGTLGTGYVRLRRATEDITVQMIEYMMAPDRMIRIRSRYAHYHRRDVFYQKINYGAIGIGYARLRRATERDPDFSRHFNKIS